jgi:succinate dehydrogenase/fumarate reductase flavoprotein subunit
MSIIDNAELLLRSSIERKETRLSFGFRRADYPDQDDTNWLAFLAIRKEGTNFVLTKMPIE